MKETSHLFRKWREQHRSQYFARRIVYAWERPSIMRKHIYTGAMGNVWASLISGIFFVYFGTTIGLNPFQWGLMGGLSSWVVVAQLFSATITERSGRRKLVWFWFAILDRCLRLAGIILAWWLWQSGQPYHGVILVGFICISNLFGNMASPPWLSWLADIIPEEEHGRFWGKRSAWIALSTIGVVVPAGFVMDKIPEDYKLFATMLIFAAATSIGILDLLIHGTIPEPAMLKPSRSHFVQTLIEPLKDKNFQPWLIFNSFWTFSMTLGGALATIYFIQELGIKDNLLGGTVVLTSFSLLGSFLSGGWSGKVVDRLGSKRVLFGGHIFWALLPAFWLFSTPHYALIWLGIGSLIGGTSSTAANTASNKLITRIPPQERRSAYAATSSTLGSLAGGFGVLVAGILLKLLSGWSVELISLSVGPFRLLFLLSCVLRLTSALLFIPMIKDPNSAVAEGHKSA
jgi:MFS family permease